MKYWFKGIKRFYHQETLTEAELHHIGGDKYLVTNVVTPRDFRLRGGAQSVMTQIVQHLDEVSGQGELTPLQIESDGPDIEILKMFYRQHGFIDDPRSDFERMVRLPIIK
jgi:hypothetical protein